MLIFCFSYDYYLDHADNGATKTIINTDTSTNPQVTQHVKRQWQQQQPAEARDATRLELLVRFFIYYTNVYFRLTQCVETGMAATASAPGSRDATRLEPFVSLFFVFLFYYANVILGPLNVKTAMEAIAAPTPAEARDATRLEPLVFILFYFYTINVNLG